MSLRTVERSVEPWRQELRNAALATVRFESPPGKQLYADFGQCVVGSVASGCGCTGGADVGVFRRLMVRAFRSEKQDHWLEAMEEGFRHWGGVPQEVLIDNARALVIERDPER